MKPTCTLTLLATLAALASFPARVQAASIAYVGTHPDLGGGWRTPAVLKPLDLDGDYLIGTDGYHLVNLPPVWPSYLSGTEILSSTFPGIPGYSFIDDPAQPGGTFLTGTMNPQPGAGASADLFRFTLSAGAVGRTIRIGLLVDNLNAAPWNAASLQLVQVNGAEGVVVDTTSATFNNRVPDWICFDIAGGAAGDSFIIRGKGGGNGTATLGGVAFDSAVSFAPPSNFTLQAEHTYGFPVLASVAVSGDTVVMGTRTNWMAFARQGTTWTEQATPLRHNHEPDDRAGFAVGVYGDTAIVGAPYEASSANTINAAGLDNNAPDSGAAYVFVRQGNTWTQQAYLKASDNTAGLFFGGAVALFGDTAVVASAEPRHDGGSRRVANGGTGAVYVFVRNGTTWTQQARLTAGNAGVDDQFGFSLGLFENTLVVGAPGEDGNATSINGDGGDNSVASSGAAYIFVRQGNTWTQQAYLKAGNNRPGNADDPHGVVGDLFGWGVAISGNTVVVGAPHEDSWGLADNDWNNNNGAAYVFVRSGNAWSQQAMLKATDEPLAEMGRAVAISGDKLLVGGGSVSDKAVTHVFERSGTHWIRNADLPAGRPIFDAAADAVLAISGGTAVIKSRTSYGIYESTAPILSVEDALGFPLAFGGGAREMAVQDGQPHSLTFTVRNRGNATLSDLAVGVDGPDAANFTLTALPAATVAPGGSTTFTVRFFAVGGAFPKRAALHLASNDTRQGTFQLELTGLNLLSTVDTDLDGMNDVAEFRSSALGFDRLVRQVPLVNAFLAGANGAGLYTAAQVQALNVDSPLLSQTAPGQFKLTIGVQKATRLTNFVAFPFVAPQTTVNGQGQLEFRFSAPDDAAFYRLEAH